MTTTAIADFPKREAWYVFSGAPFPGGCPDFFEISDYPEFRKLEEHWDEIATELVALLESHECGLKPYIHRALAFPPGEWKTLGFYFWGIRVGNNHRRCPRLIELLREIPNLTAASLSVLEPGVRINPHRGDTDAIARVHIGLLVPGEFPDCALQVGDEVRSWQPGRAMAFCDAQPHWAWNMTDKRRAVLIMDVMRPEYLHQSREIRSRVLSSILIQALPGAKFWWKFPAAVRSSLWLLATLVMRIYTSLPWVRMR